MAFFRSGGIRIALVILAVMAVAAAGGALAIYVLLIRDLPDFQSLDDYRPPVVTEVLDREGRLIGEFYTEQRRLVPMDAIPELVKYAFVAAEDGSFFEHKGIDYQSILRAAIANLREGGIAQGASTITQQTVKSLLLTPERTYKRKMREIILARRIEQKFSKQEILYLYLNQIYFGNGAWGIGQAARNYFGKEAPDLTISEAALLAGLPQRPSSYDPRRNPKAAEARRRYVLGRMLADEYIDEATYQDELARPPEIRDHEDLENLDAARYFAEEVRRLLFDHLDDDVVLNAGLTIETTLDADLQRVAHEAVQAGLHAHDHRRGYRGPIRRVGEADIAEELARIDEANEGRLETTEVDFDLALLHEWLEGRVALGFGRARAATAEQAPGEADPAGRSAAADAAASGEDPAGIEAIPTLVRYDLPRATPLEGIVLEVDREAQAARIGFGPDLAGAARLDDVEWAREPDPTVSPRPVTKIQRIFRVGDVARFVRLPDLEEEESEDAEDEGEGLPLARLDLWQEPLAEGALLSIENATGDVLAMIGGYDFGRSEFNRAVQAERQPGSAFKPFIYGAALTRGYTPVSQVVDRPVVYTDPVSGFVWAPRNYGRKFYGPMTMRDALKKSINNATVHLFRDLGVRYVIDYARRMGIESPLSQDLSLALGSSSLTLLELTRAYAVYPRGGSRVVPRFIRRVVDREGNELIGEVPLGGIPPLVEDSAETDDERSGADTADERVPDDASDEGEDEAPSLAALEIPPPVQLISPADAYLMSDLLRAVVQEGTGRGLRYIGRTIAGKTGTTNDFTDAWFMGFSPEITTGVWVGHDDNETLGWGESGGRTALPIWGNYMKVALAPYPRRDFEVPEHIEFLRIDKRSGLLAEAQTQDAYFQPFLEGTAPERSFTEQTSSDQSEQAARDDIF